MRFVFISSLSELGHRCNLRLGREALLRQLAAMAEWNTGQQNLAEIRGPGRITQTAICETI